MSQEPEIQQAVQIDLRDYPVYEEETAGTQVNIIEQSDKPISKEDMKEFLSSLSMSSDITDDENNWTVDESSGIPELDILPDPGHVKDKIAKVPYTKKDDYIQRQRKRNEELLKKLPKAAIHHDIFYRVLDNILNWDIGIGIALDRISIELEEVNLPSITSPAFQSFEKTKNKIESIMLMEGFIRASGLMEFREDIMKEFIKSSFDSQRTPNLKELLDKYSGG